MVFVFAFERPCVTEISVVAARRRHVGSVAAARRDPCAGSVPCPALRGVVELTAVTTMSIDASCQSVNKGFR